jgi:hypothetical protein
MIHFFLSNLVHNYPYSFAFCQVVYTSSLHGVRPSRNGVGNQTSPQKQAITNTEIHTESEDEIVQTGCEVAIKESQVHSQLSRCDQQSEIERRKPNKPPIITQRACFLQLLLFSPTGWLMRLHVGGDRAAGRGAGCARRQRGRAPAAARG